MKTLTISAVLVLVVIAQCAAATLLYGYAYRPYAMTDLPVSQLALALTFFVPLFVAVAAERKALQPVSPPVRLALLMVMGFVSFFLSVSCAFSTFGT